MWLGIFSGSQFEKTLDNTQHGEKQNRCNQCDYASSQASNLRTHFKTHNGEKSNKCDFACIWKQTVEKIQTNVRRANVLQPTTIPGKQFIATSISWGKLYKTALGKGLKIVGKITQFSRPFSLLVTDMDPIHNKPLRSLMCGINHLHMNSTQIKDQIFPVASSSSRPPCTPSSPSSSTSLIWSSMAEIIWWTGSPIVSLQGWGRIQTDL